jgi:hypothetical protein
MDKSNKKGAMSLGQIPSFVWVLVISGLFLGIGLTVLAEFGDQVATHGDAQSAINETIDALGGVSDWFDIIVVVAVAGIILALVAVFGFGMGKGGAQ